MEKPIWQPSQAQVKQSNIYSFLQAVNRDTQQNLQSYLELYQWSKLQIELFWQMVWKFCGIKAQQQAHTILANSDKMPGAQWFQGAKLNFVENLLSRQDDKIALVFHSESYKRRILTYAELYKKVAQCANGLKEQGIKPGDHIAAYLPNTIETVIAMLATTSLGAIWSCCSPEFGVDAVVERFSQIRPKIFFAIDQQIFNGKTYHKLNKIKEIVEQLASVQQTIIVPSVPDRQVTSELKNHLLFDDFLSDDVQITFPQFAFNHPLYVMFSSGTTGKPKCIVHGVGGTLIQHLKELVLHTDLTAADTMFYYTTSAWMMWNWMISSLAVGSTIILYDGSPTYPHFDALFDIIEQEGVSIFGTSAKYLSSLEKNHIKPNEKYDLSQLKTILSSGSPLNPGNYDYVYAHIKKDLMLCSISGGTDIISCFALGNPMLPIYRGELQSPGLGMDIDIFDEQGQSLLGEKGELVCKSPFPSMPLYFSNDPTGERYKQAYFAKFPGIWAHGDYAMLTKHGGLIIYGRSDTVLNPGGIRIGTAEIYQQVEKIDEIIESVVVGQQWHDDVRIILFVRLRKENKLTQQLKEKIKTQIHRQLSPRHVPSKIVQVNDIPKTMNGKIVELAIRNIIHGIPIKNKEAIANPQALKQFANIAELQCE